MLTLYAEFQMMTYLCIRIIMKYASMYFTVIRSQDTIKFYNKLKYYNYEVISCFYSCM